MSNVTWATQFAKQQILRTVTIGYQPYLPFSQQWAMDYQSKGEKGYFDYSPKAISGNPQDSTTQRGDKYSFEARMKAYMGLGVDGLEHMSTYYGSDNRAKKSVEAAPQSGRTAAANRSRELSELFQSKMGASHLPVDMPGGRDYGEESLGQLSAAFDKEFKGGSAAPNINRGETKTGKFYGANFDKMMESEGSSMRGFLDATIGRDKMKDVHSMEMTRAKAGSKMSKVLSMNQEEIDSPQYNGMSMRKKFKTHVNNTFADYNRRITDAVKAMVDTGVGSGEFQKYKGKTGSDIFASRGLFPIHPDGHMDKALNDNIRQFIGRAGHTAMIKSLNNAGKGPSLNINQVRLGRNMIGFAVVGLKVRHYKKQAYPQILMDKATTVITMPAGTENNLIDAYGAWMKDNSKLSNAEIQKEITKATAYASDRLIATTDRMARVYESADTHADLMATKDMGIAVGSKVLSNVRLLPMDIAENLRQQILKHFKKTGFTDNFRKWYNQIEADSNRLTKQWAKNSPSSSRKHKTKFSKEWVFGDNEGNPNKRFLGIWSKQSQNTWKQSIGRNIAIAPFIISRRKGVAAFRKGGDFDKG